ncbi:MAG: NAD(P)-dependent oxidoreductase [Pseudomonadota bacterium]|nr:NAD(P)-dependent oxidoreductase [Pseudomonadota bacterium]
MTKLLVTGGTGLIGAQVARAALARGMTPVLFDADPQIANILDIKDQVIVERGDVVDLADLLRVSVKHGITHVVHLAAILTIQSTLNPARALRINCIGTSNIFQLARDLGFRRVVYASSAAVYGTRGYYEETLGRHTVTEDDATRPYDLYGHTKQMCEGLAEQALRDGLDVVGLRPVMTFGYGRLDGAVGILVKAMQDAAEFGRGLVTHPWQADTMINPMYVKDAADIFLTTLLAERKLARPVYNLGTGEYMTIREMMDLAVRMAPQGSRIVFEETASTEAGGKETPLFDYADLDSSLLRRELNWSPKYGFEAGAADTLADLRILA